MKLPLTAYAGVPRLFDTLSHKDFLWALIGSSLLLHAGMGLAQQGKYWWDTIAYFDLARVLFEPAKLASLYAGDFGIVYTHVMPGVPFVIRTFDQLFGEWMFPVIVMLQIALNAFAVVYFVTAFAQHLSRLVQFALIVLLSFNPYYAAFHNALLTESFSSTLLLFLAGAFVRGADGTLDLRRAVTLVLALGFIGAQYRLYFFAFSLVGAFLLISSMKGRARLYFATLALTCGVASVALFPAYRAWAGGGFFLPHTNALMLMHAAYVAWDLPQPQTVELRRTVKDPVVLSKLAGHTELDVADTIKMGKDLEASGLTRAEMGREILKASWSVRTSSLAAIRRQVQASLQSLGFQLLIGCCSLREEGRRGFTRAAMIKHDLAMQRWNSGTAEDNYLSRFDSFAERYRESANLYAPESINLYVSRVRPFIASQSTYWRDPLFMSRIPADLLVLAGLAGLIVLARKNWKVGLFFVTVAGSIYVAVLFAAIIGDNRYAHALIPIYFVSAAVLATEAARWSDGAQRRRSGARTISGPDQQHPAAST